MSTAARQHFIGFTLGHPARGEGTLCRIRPQSLDPIDLILGAFDERVELDEVNTSVVQATLKGAPHGEVAFDAEPQAPPTPGRSAGKASG